MTVSYIIFLFIFNYTINALLTTTTTTTTTTSTNKQIQKSTTTFNETSSSSSLNPKLHLHGHWFNKGVEYRYCTAAAAMFTKHEQFLLNLKQKYKDCDKLSIQLLSIDNKIDLDKSDYELLVKKIICILQKINCPINEKSFQIHDIPCQSSCLSLLSVCGQLRNTPQSSFINIPSICSNNPIQTSQKRWIYEANTNTNNHYYQTTEAPIQSLTSYNTYDNNNPFHSKRYIRYPNYMNSMPSSPKSFLLEDGGHHGFHKYFNLKSKYNNQLMSHRLPRQVNANKDVLFNNPSEYLTLNAKRSVEYFTNQNLNKLHLQFTPSQRKSSLLMQEDCLLLPPGGCDKWMDPSTNLQRLKAPNYREYLKLNYGCPKDIPETCNSMFPNVYSRSKWIKSNFTVSAIIRISGTLWWFGKNDRFQPLFRFHVLKTFDSDIHPYDEKMILTYSWPLQCICIDEIIVGKKYLMLTHSFKARQTLHITKDTVFLSRVRRYTRKLACWKGACTVRSSGNRKRSYYIQSNMKQTLNGDNSFN
ncbi:unnamed protein product [Schistosoma turkestanicum]|nr:unnamed protein product [Schistosoma turkestanicum]